MRRALTISFSAAALTIGLAVGLVSCSTLPRIVGAETAQSVEVNALKAARTALTVWSLAQDAAIVYGRLPTCDPEIPELKVCKDRATWQKIKTIDAIYSAKIGAARPLIEAGTNDAAFLIGVVTLVNDGVIEINQARGVTVQ